MPALDLIDHSPHHPSASAPLSNASNLILIDNYDSFTWNVYQYLVLEGATVTVYRNDEISLADLIAKNPTQLVVSPGPGHPDRDAGISNEAIKYFGGKIPVLGVCMGEQCLYSVYGGQVDVTGEILHGKTSPLRHDSKGVYEGLPQDLPVTRYHSLAGTHPTLPECLEVSSWIVAGPDGGKGVIMGVRHKEFLIEGVQFHPESILTAEGRTMLKNFLKMRGGTWVENEQISKSLINGHQVNGMNGEPRVEKPKSENILETIFAHRKTAVAMQKQIPSQRLEDLQAAYVLNLSPPQISFVDRLKKSPYSLALAAEIKRASPSKGIISLSTCAPAQARTYALAGASVISVLTEPEWFKGSIEDLRAVRQSLEGMLNRPAVLRKEFIFDEYQILEARLAGADTVLLIVKMLDRALLQRLYCYSQSLGMEPLVEVNTAEEMEIAISLGSKVIGVNNRNLVNFEVDLDTTSRLMNGVPTDTIICALSGISGPKDVEAYRRNGVKAVLVGEALMRASNTTMFISELLGEHNSDAPRPESARTLVKICGTRSPEAAAAAIEAGADLIGMILVPSRKRCVSDKTALEISAVVHNTSRPASSVKGDKSSTEIALDYFSHTSSAILTSPNRTLLVGVFQNQTLDDVLEKQKLLNLDIIQFHGNEPLEWATLVPVPVIRAFNPGNPGLGKRGYHAIPLLDAGNGGSGTSLESDTVAETITKDSQLKIFLAGGLNPDNVVERLQALGNLRSHVIGVDVSSGVEENSKQSVSKIKAFVEAVRAADDLAAL